MECRCYLLIQSPFTIHCYIRDDCVFGCCTDISIERLAAVGVGTEEVASVDAWLKITLQDTGPSQDMHEDAQDMQSDRARSVAHILEAGKLFKVVRVLPK